MTVSGPAGLQQMIRSAGERVFSEADADKSNTLNLDEFKNLVDGSDIPIAQKIGGNAERAFNAMDANADGSLSKSEIREHVQSKMQSQSANFLGALLNKMELGDSPLGKAVGEQQAKTNMASADQLLDVLDEDEGKS